jgi:hypothetical protein
LFFGNLLLAVVRGRPGRKTTTMNKEQDSDNQAVHGVREPSIPLIPAGPVVRLFAQFVGRGTPERGAFGFGTLGDRVSDSRSESSPGGTENPTPFRGGSVK